MLQMSAGLSSSLNRCTNPTSDHSAKPFYPHATSAKLLKCWWSQKQNPGGLSKARMWQLHRGHLRIRAECRQPPDSPRLLNGTQSPVLPSIWLHREVFFKHIKTQGVKIHELIIIFLPHPCFPKTGNRKGDGGSTLVVPGVWTAVQSGKQMSRNRMSYHMLHTPLPAQRGTRLVYVNQFFPQLYEVFF